MNKLSTTEKSDLQKLKKVVSEGEKNFIVVGNALLEIRDRKLYREESLTFDLFCIKAWGWKRANAYRMIDAAETVRMSPIGRQIPNERIARELKDVPPEKHKEVMAKASESGKPSAASVAKAASEITKPVADIELDRIGVEVPKKAMPFWKRREEVQGLLAKLTSVKAAVKHAQDNKDILFTEVNFSSVLAYLDNTYGGIKRAMPYAVCPKCQGKLVERCGLCGGRGVISECLYSRVDEESKHMQQKAAKK